LLPGHAEVVAIEDRLGSQGREIGARPRLRESEAPEIARREDAWQEASLLLVGAVGDDRRSGNADAEGPDHLGRPHAGHLLDVPDLLGNAGIAPAELPRPVDADPPGVGELLLPPPQATDALLIRQPGRVLGPEAIRHVGLQPRTQLLPEGVDRLARHAACLTGQPRPRRAGE